MKDAVRQTRLHLLQLFEQHGFHPRTDLGQNFLIDLNLVEYIARQAELKPRDVVLEIGAGTGGLTTFLAAKAGDVVSIEVDQRMAGLAQAVIDGRKNVTLLNIDALKSKNRFAPELLAVLREKLNGPENQPSTINHRPAKRLKLVANLPYNIATPVVSNLVAGDLPWERMVVTIQWELAQRMTARPGTSHYGSLAVWLQSQCFVKILKKLPPNVFWPRPKVQSAIVQLRPNPAGREQIADRRFFQDFLRRLFHQRRKLARGVLCGMYRKQLAKPEVDAILAELGHHAELRAEQMDVADFVQLANRLRAAMPAAERQKTALRSPKQ